MRSKILILLSLLGILLTLFAVQGNQKIESGKINSIEYSNKKITLSLENYQRKLIIFDNKILNLKKGDFIEFMGTKKRYKQKEQIIINKIWKLS